MAAPDLGFPTVQNVGPGPALDVDIAVVFEPLPNNERLTRRWTASVIAPGESREFLPPRKGQSQSMRTKDLAATYSSIRLTGNYLDALGKQHVADDVLPDIAAWVEVTHAAQARWRDPDIQKRQAKEIADHLGKKVLVPALSAIEKRLGQP